jgi:radical SAM superfamily enzyme YgiQ (UPF0313 family)
MRCYKYADYFRKRGIRVGLGGVHPTMMPDEAAQHADFIMTGFSEQTWPQALYDFRDNCLKPRYAQNADYSIVGKPHPRRDLLKINKYITGNTVEAVRGCTLPCTFCAYPAAFGRTLHKRPVREVMSEIETFDGKIVLFPDVNLLAERSYAMELFKSMIPLKRHWFGLVTSAIGIDDEMIKLFRQSGCKGLLIGFESVSGQTQKFINKGVNRQADYAEVMKKLHDAGILIQGCFAFGGDDEDSDVFAQTVELADKIKIDLPRYSILTPFPGTRLYRDLEAQGRIIERNWAMYDVEHCVFRPKLMSKEQLETGIEWAWRQSYTFKSIVTRLAPFKVKPLISIGCNLGYRTYASKFKKFTREIMTDNSDIPD